MTNTTMIDIDTKIEFRDKNGKALHGIILGYDNDQYMVQHTDALYTHNRLWAFQMSIVPENMIDHIVAKYQ